MQLTALLYKNFAWRGFFYITSLAVNVAIARQLGAGLSGGLYFFLNNLYLALLIGSISLDSGITYYVSKKELPENKLALFSFIWAILVSILIAVLFGVFYTSNPGIFKSNFLFYACISFTLGTFLNIFFTAFFYSHDDYKTPNLVSGSINLLLLICIPWKPGWLGFINDKIYLFIFFAATLMQGIIIFVCWKIQRGSNFIFKSFSLKEISPALKYSVAALAGNLAYFLLYRVDYWFVEYYCTSKSLGKYIQVSRLGQLLILPCTIIAAALFPLSSKQNVSFETGTFIKLFRSVFIIYVLGGLFTWVFGKSLILFLWGNEYDEMYQPLMLTMPGIIFLAVSYLFSPIFAGKGKVSYNVIICLVALIVVVLFNFLLVPRWGIRGAAIATTAGFTVMMVLYFVFAKLKYDFSLRNLFINKSE